MHTCKHICMHIHTYFRYTYIFMLIHTSIHTCSIHTLLAFVRSYEGITEFMIISCTFLNHQMLKDDWREGNFFLILKRVQHAEKYQQLLFTDNDKGDTYRIAISVFFSRW